MSVRRLALSAVFSALFLTACHSTGNNFSSRGLDQLEPGMASFDDAIVLLQAEPTNRYYRPDGSYMARWAHVGSLLPDAIYFDRELWLEFDAGDRLVKINKRQNINTAVTSEPISP